MSTRERYSQTGLWLACGGLVILATHQLLAVSGPGAAAGNLPLLAGAIAGYFITAAGVLLSVANRSRDVSGPVEPAALSARDEPPIHEDPDAVCRMTAHFLDWCEERLPDSNPWNAFDQLVREMLTDRLGAVRIRCYQVLPGDQQLRSLSQHGTPTNAKCARTGILGHVATTGQEFYAADPAQGELVRQLAADDDGDAWEWVHPIRDGSVTIGLIAIGKLPAEARLARDRRQSLAASITMFWRHVVCLQQLQIAERTDKVSGLLTRSDFVESASRALSESYADNEPVVVVALALEGLRWLDDTGRWSDRDALVESIGLLINRRIRTDDIIGRFSDDRFVLLLRRLDSSLGKLIATKIQNTAQEQIAQLEGVDDALRVRVGLTGSGFQKQPLEELLVSAFDAVEQARRRDAALYCDLSESSAGGTPPGRAHARNAPFGGETPTREAATS